MSNIALYEISNKYQMLLNNILDAEDITDEHQLQLAEIKDAVESKSINIASFIKNMEAAKDSIHNAIQLMKDRENRLGNKIDRMIDYLKVNMENCGITEISQYPYFTIKLKKCPYSVEIIDELKIPDKYKKSKQVISVDKKALHDDMKNNGVIIEGARLIQNTRLEIK